MLMFPSILKLLKVPPLLGFSHARKGTLCTLRGLAQGNIRSRLVCWWFGCEEDPQDPAPPTYTHCVRCGELVSYSDLVGDTRHYRFSTAARYWLLRKWWPHRCGFCGHRYTCNESVDHIPF